MVSTHAEQHIVNRFPLAGYDDLVATRINSIRIESSLIQTRQIASVSFKPDSAGGGNSASYATPNCIVVQAISLAPDRKIIDGRNPAVCGELKREGSCICFLCVDLDVVSGG